MKGYKSLAEAQEQARVDKLKNSAQMIAFLTKKIEELQSFLQIEYVRSQTKPFFIEQQEDFLDILEAYDDKWLKYDIWLYQDILYGLNTNLSQDEQQLLILDFADKERLKFERLAARFSQDQTEHIKYERTRIPGD